MVAPAWLDPCPAARYVVGMPQQPNFGDPEFEPTDGQLQALTREAFAGVAEEHRRALARLRAEIEALRSEALARLGTPPSAPDPPGPLPDSRR